MRLFFNSYNVAMLSAEAEQILHGIVGVAAGLALADLYTDLIAQKGTYYQLYTGAFELE